MSFHNSFSYFKYGVLILWIVFCIFYSRIAFRIWVHFLICLYFHIRILRAHPLSTYAKFSEELTFLTPWYAHVRLPIRGLEMLVFRKILRTYVMNDPYDRHKNTHHFMGSWVFFIKPLFTQGIFYVDWRRASFKILYFFFKTLTTLV